MYCNCKDISSFWDDKCEVVFPILEEIYKGRPRRDIPMIEVIRNHSTLYGYSDESQTLAGDIYFIQVAKCTCKNRPLIRISEKCLGLENRALVSVLTQAVAKLNEQSSGEFVVNEADFGLEAF